MKNCILVPRAYPGVAGGGVGKGPGNEDGKMDRATANQGTWFLRIPDQKKINFILR